MNLHKDWYNSSLLVACEGADFSHFLRKKFYDEIGNDSCIYDFKKQDDQISSGKQLTKWIQDIFFNRYPETSLTKAMGIVVDAEDDTESMLQSIQYSLKTNNLPVPDSNLAFASDGDIAIGICIVPSNASTGCLEDMLLEAKSEKLLFNSDCVDSFADCCLAAYVEKHGCNPRSDDKSLARWKAKLKVHASIAGSKKPDIKLGQTARAGYWDDSKGSLKQLKEFLIDLRSKATP